MSINILNKPISQMSDIYGYFDEELPGKTIMSLWIKSLEF